MDDLDREFKRFKQHCEFQFWGPLNAKTQFEKVNYLMTYMGDKEREIYNTLTWAPAVPADPDHHVEAVPAENHTLTGVFEKFEAYVRPKRNQIRATVNFHRRKQKSEERFDNFVTDLRVLVRDCGYVEEERMLRDAIVLNSYHAKVREKCLDQGDDITLQAAVRIGQNFESSQESMKAIGEDRKVNLVKGSDNRKRNDTRSKGPIEKNKQCCYCGYEKDHKVCPAKSATCNYCLKYGHFEKMCISKKKSKFSGGHKSKGHSRGATNYIGEDTESEGSSDESEGSPDEYALPIHTITVNKINENNEWFAKVKLTDKTVNCQIDTGATQSLIPFKLWKRLGKSHSEYNLHTTQKQFQSYTQHPIEVAGRVDLPVVYKKQSIIARFYVVHANQLPILSGKASKALNLIQRVSKIDSTGKGKYKNSPPRNKSDNEGKCPAQSTEPTSDPKIEEMYPELRNMTGTLPGVYSLKIDPTIPPVIHPPRRQHKALTDRIIAKLHEMEREGHITPVNEPTDWVSSMVTVVKNDKIRICIDPKD
jgi:hypothetical protein